MIMPAQGRARLSFPNRNGIPAIEDDYVPTLPADTPLPTFRSPIGTRAIASPLGRLLLSLALPVRTLMRTLPSIGYENLVEAH